MRGGAGGGRGERFVPPAEADQAAPRDVLEVVEVGCEQEGGEDEDQDTGERREGVSAGWRSESG